MTVTQAELTMFGDRFGEAVQLFEEASRYGTSPKLEERYSKIRAWLLLHYRSVRGVLRPLLPVEERQSMMWHGGGQDSFERLMAFTTLERAVGQPEGELSQRSKAVLRALETLTTPPVAV